MDKRAIKQIRQCAELAGLDDRRGLFVLEYMKDLNPRLAAVRSNIDPDKAYELLDEPRVRECIDTWFARRIDESNIDAEWLLAELVDNHMLARLAGNLSASNQALLLIARHNGVDALASDKLNVNVDKDAAIADRLRRGRERNHDALDFMGDDID